jgi:hypothetical protein
VKSEGALSSALLSAARLRLPGVVAFKHADRFTSGVPDISLSWGRTAWLETKATDAPRIRLHKNWGLQLLTAQRLERATGLCWFVVFSERADGRLTRIVRPRDMKITGDWSESVAAFPGYDHEGVIEFIKGALRA